MPSWRSSPGLKAGTTPNGSSPDWAWAAQTNTKQRSTLTPPTSTPPSRLETRNGASNKAGDPHRGFSQRAWSPLILKAPRPSPADQHADPNVTNPRSYPKSHFDLDLPAPGLRGGKGPPHKRQAPESTIIPSSRSDSEFTDTAHAYKQPAHAT